MRLGKPGDAVSTSGSVMRQIINEQLQISESNPIKARYYDYDRFTYPWHFHSQYEIIYVKKSCGRCFVGDCIERFSEGDVVLFGPSLPHYMRSDDAYHGDNPRLRVQGTIIQFEENFMQYSFDHYPQFHQIRVLLKEARRGCCLSHGRCRSGTRHGIRFSRTERIRTDNRFAGFIAGIGGIPPKKDAGKPLLL